MRYDIIVVGAGPAGLTAAVYGARAKKQVLVIEKGAMGGQITNSPLVENIPGFSAVSGNEFAEKMVEQVELQGAGFDFGEVLSVEKTADGSFEVKTDFDTYQASTVILATGTTHRTLGLENEQDYIGNGISFCAVCDGAFYKDKDVTVIGGGNSALQEAVLLSELCHSVTMVQNLDFLTGETKLQDIIYSRKNVTVITGSVVNRYLDENGQLNGIEIKSVSTGELNKLDTDGVFLAIGLIPQNKPFADLTALDRWGYFDAGEDCLSSQPGLFVAGDCRKKNVRQVTTAVSDGAVAALAACRYLDDLALLKTEA